VCTPHGRNWINTLSKHRPPSTVCSSSYAEDVGIVKGEFTHYQLLFPCPYVGCHPLQPADPLCLHVCGMGHLHPVSKDFRGEIHVGRVEDGVQDVPVDLVVLREEEELDLSLALTPFRVAAANQLRPQSWLKRESLLTSVSSRGRPINPSFAIFLITFAGIPNSTVASFSFMVTPPNISARISFRTGFACVSKVALLRLLKERNLATTIFHRYVSGLWITFLVALLHPYRQRNCATLISWPSVSIPVRPLSSGAG